MKQYEPSGGKLASLLDERDHLSVQISLFQDSAAPDPLKLFEMQRRLQLLDRSIVTTQAGPRRLKLPTERSRPVMDVPG
jgi:hypothetical protein